MRDTCLHFIHIRVPIAYNRGSSRPVYICLILSAVLRSWSAADGAYPRRGPAPVADGALHAASGGAGGGAPAAGRHRAGPAAGHAAALGAAAGGADQRPAVPGPGGAAEDGAGHRPPAQGGAARPAAEDRLLHHTTQSR